jgi:hypothetical protein
MNPPRLATWLLQRWGSGSRQVSLVGDLIEQYRDGRSRGWYWRQVLRAIVVGAVHDIREHRLLAVRASVGGFLLLLLSIRLVQTMYNEAGVLVWNWTVTHGWDTARGLWFGSPTFPEPPVSLVARWVSPAMIGWGIARFHRRQSLAMLSSFAAVTYVANVALWLSAVGPTLALRVVVYMHPMVTPILFLHAPAVILLGGLLGSRSNYDTVDQSALG